MIVVVDAMVVSLIGCYTDKDNFVIMQITSVKREAVLNGNFQMF
jgi:hypothetical protein